MDVPRLETERLILRGPEASDLDASAAMWGDPDVGGYILGRASTRQESWFRLLRHLGHWAALGYGYWTVADRASGAFLGEVGLADWHRELDPSLDGEPEAGWVFAASAQGRGLATEAVRRALAWADDRLEGPSTACIVNPGHVASIRLARAVGYEDAGVATHDGEPVRLMRRRRDRSAAGPAR